MKILVVSTVQLKKNGIATVIMNIYETCKDVVNMDFVVNDSISEDYRELIEKNKSKVYVLNRKKNIINYIKELIGILRAGNYDCLHVHGNSGTMVIEMMIAKLMKLPKRISHSHNTSCSHMKVHYALRNLMSILSTTRLACSKEAGCFCFGQREFDVIPNGIKVSRYQYNAVVSTDVRKELGINEKFVVGHVGLINEQKNTKKVINVFAELKKRRNDLKLLMVTGTECVPQEINEMIEKNDIEEDIIWLFERKDVDKLLMAMDVFVFPSKWEGLGIGVIEAQASGLKCVISSVVPEEVNITKLIKRLDVNESDKIWADELETCMVKYDRTKCFNDVYQSKFNIEKYDAKLKEIYLRG